MEKQGPYGIILNFIFITKAISLDSVVILKAAGRLCRFHLGNHWCLVPISPSLLALSLPSITPSLFGPPMFSPSRISQCTTACTIYKILYIYKGNYNHNKLTITFFIHI